MAGRGMNRTRDLDPVVTELLRDWGTAVMLLGWSDSDTNAALGYVRNAYYRGDSIGDALVEVYQQHEEGRLRPDDP